MAGKFNFLPVLFFALSTLVYVTGQHLIASIDCGGTTTMTDDNTITWTPDTISSGVARMVKPSYSLNSVLDTLRVFTSRKKNCYSIRVTQGIKILARANFNYGNYDGLLNPPTFALIFDGNFWTTVETSLDGLVRYEAIFVAKGDNVSVCLAQTIPNQFPFISSLAIRSLDSDVYSEVNDNRAIFLDARLSYGAIGYTRYPDDIYDRIWESSSTLGSIESVPNDALYIDATAPDNPPKIIFENAITVPTKSQGIRFAQIQPYDSPKYINMYFSEVTNLDFPLTRSFSIYEYSIMVQFPITPPYTTVVERSIYNIEVTSPTNITLFATSSSDLPPIINALEKFTISDVLSDGTNSNDEKFTISDVLSDGTNSNDVKALRLLQSTFSVLNGWSDDPCLPAPYSWDWLDCSNNATPRVTSLHLDSFDLSGSLPDISSMDALEIIDLHNNSLSGTIPSFLGTMPNLQQLNLADNKLSGSIPASLSNNNKLKLTVTGNPFLCTSGTSCSSSPGTINPSPGSPTRATKKKSKMLPLILAIGIAVIVLIIGVVIAVIIIVCRKSTNRATANTPVIPTVNPDGRANMNLGVGANMNPDVQPGVGGAPSPQYGTPVQTSNFYGQTGVQYR